MLAEPLKSLRKKGKNAQNRKEFLEKEKGREIQKGKEKKIRVINNFLDQGLISPVFVRDRP